MRRVSGQQKAVWIGGLHEMPRVSRVGSMPNYLLSAAAGVLASSLLGSMSVAYASPEPSPSEISTWLQDCERETKYRDCENDVQRVVDRLAESNSEREYNWLWTCSRQSSLTECENEYKELFLSHDRRTARHRKDDVTARAIGRVVGYLVVGGLSLAAAHISRVLWRRRTRKALDRLSEIEAGERCLSCGTTRLERLGNTIKCRSCGFEASETDLRKKGVRPSDISALTSRAGDND